MNIGITTDIVDSEKYHKGVANYIKCLVKNIVKFQSDHNYCLIHHHSNPDAIYQLGLSEKIVPLFPCLPSGVSKILVSVVRARKLFNEDLGVDHDKYKPMDKIKCKKKTWIKFKREAHIDSIVQCSA